jgi:hypothetical protein
MWGQEFAQLVRVFFSAVFTVSRHRVFVATQSPPGTGCHAGRSRTPAAGAVVHDRAPESHASANGTKWSTSRSAGLVQDAWSYQEYHRPPISLHDEPTVGAVVASAIKTS